MVGVNKKAKSLENCKGFVKELMSEKAQAKDSGIGFPINRKAAAELIKAPTEDDMIMYYRIMDNQGRILDFHIDESELIKSYIALGDELDTPVQSDEQLFELILQESQGYFEGKEAISETIKKINSKARLYLLE